MARTKNPEQTIAKILNTSMKLFVEKGYESTTIQDIINDLGMSKGAIYHHFKSKEDILVAAMDASGEVLFAEITAIIDGEDGNALEKLRKVMLYCLQSSHQQNIAKAVPSFLQNPKFLAMQIESDHKENAPKVFEPLFRMGIADGSIQTEYPKELAQVLAMVFNIWLSPYIFQVSDAEFRHKFNFLQHMTKSLGVDVFTDELIDAIFDMTEYFPRSKEL